MPPLLHAFAILAILVTGNVALAQTTEQKEPVFASGGIRTKVVSIAATPDKQSVTIGALIENISQDDQLIAMIGQAPRAIDNKGNVFVAMQNTISGVALCNLNPADPQRATAACLDTSSPYGLPVERYTLLEKGASLTITLQFLRQGGAQQPLGEQITFAALIVVRQVTNYGTPGSKPTMGPVKQVSIGIPLIPLGG
jgi:hypothetical protein